MRFGFTTGSCAAAAAKAAAYMLLTGKLKEEIRISTPKGIDFNAQIVDIDRSERSVSCAVIKDGGDDPDITTGCHVVAKVSIGGAGGAGGPVGEEDAAVEGAPAAVKAHFSGSQPSVHISGGKGVGLVTKPGLDQEPGNAAINSVPRQMIQKEVLEVCELCDYKGALEVEISVPEGEALALKTFNPRLGIEGGISILGTSGIVEPMSSQALLDTIKVELRQKRALGCKIAVVAPGNYGLDFMKNSFSFDLDRAVKCSNFIGDSLEMAVELGFEKYLHANSIRVIKFFLNLSKNEQKKRFLDRINRPEKNWKFSENDIKERQFFEKYQEAFEAAINNTSTKDCPWYVIPADQKWFARYLVSEIILSVMKDINPKFPEITKEQKDNLANCKKMLEGEA